MEADYRPQREATMEIMQENHGSLVSSIKEKMANASLSYRICRVPEKNSKENVEKYVPIVVSIGPFHREKDTLKTMVDQKWRYLNTLLSRKLNLDASLESCVIALKDLEQRARKCYGEEIQMESNEFVTMMLVDGCFIIELFLKSSFKGLRRKDDPFFTSSEVFSRLRCDMILLENQIPFFVIQQLFSLVPIPKQCNYSLTGLAIRFLRKTIPGDPHILPEKFGQEVHHLLDLIYQFIHPTFPEVYSKGVQTNIPHATKLKKSGIGFKKAKTKSLLDIKLVDGVLEIPPLKILNHTEIVLRNLIAKEHCLNDVKKYVTSYVFLMKSLIQSKEDVRFLCQKRVLDKGVGKEKDFLSLLNKITMEVEVKDFYYRGLCDQVNGYRKLKRSVWCA